MDDKEFTKLLDKYLKNSRDKMKNEYNRVLPTGELLFNRFDKANYLKCGEGTSIYDTSVIMGDIKIGENVWIGPYTLLEGINAKLTIGNYVSIDTGVTIYTHDSTKYHVSGGKNSFLSGDVSIGDNTVIGTMSMISCGVSIGNKCVIAAHSFVNCDVPDNSIVAGIPAKIIGKVMENEDGTVEFKYF